MSMNEMNRLPYLESWCKSYFDKVGLKIHPSNVPTEVVLNDIMEQLTMVICHDKSITTIYDHMNERVKALEEQLNSVTQSVCALLAAHEANEELKRTSTKKVK